jgi:hypothetical protein
LEDLVADSIELLKFDDALGVAEAADGKKHLLLGNGFSIGAHALFKYGMLYEQARKAGLPKHVQKIFDRYGTTNFEEVLRQLDEGQWMADHYEMQKTREKPDMRDDYEQVKRALAEAIANSHPPFPSAVGEEKLAAAREFMSQFHNIFTTNYDLLPYWASVDEDSFPFDDGFGREIDTDDSYCVFLPASNSNPHMYFLHGALHLYTMDGEVRKMVWRTTNVPLIEQVKSGLESKRYPLVVSEGDTLGKSKRIEASSYLSHALRRFENIKGSLFIYGSSLGSQDDHIWEAIAQNIGLPQLFVGIHGKPTSQRNAVVTARAEGIASRRATVVASRRSGGRRTRATGLEVRFFDTASAKVWDVENTLAKRVA